MNATPRAALLALLVTAALAAQAQPRFQPQSFVDHARVQAVEPQYDNVQVPRQECRSQWLNEPRSLIGHGQPRYEQAQREVRSCHTVVDMQRRLTGYRVSYAYAGQQYSTFTRKQPGSTLPVRVSVIPAQEREYYRPN